MEAIQILNDGIEEEEIEMKVGKEVKRQFEELCEIEPEFKELYNDCKKFVPVEKKPISEPKLSSYWYHEYKPRMVELVMKAEEEASLRDINAYHIAYSFLLETLYNRWKQYCYLTWHRRDKWENEEE